MNNIGIWYTLGDGLVVHGGWGMRYYGDSWLEECKGRGLVTVGGHGFEIGSVKIVSCRRDQALVKNNQDSILRLERTEHVELQQTPVWAASIDYKVGDRVVAAYGGTYSFICAKDHTSSGANIGTDWQVNHLWNKDTPVNIDIRNSVGVTVTGGNHVAGALGQAVIANSEPSILINIDSTSSGSTVVGNLLHMVNSANAYALQMAGYGNTVVGNTRIGGAGFSFGLVTEVLATYGANTIANNTGAELEASTELLFMRNATGGTLPVYSLCMRKNTVAPNEALVCTAAGIKDFCGLSVIADASGTVQAKVQRYGWTQKFPINAAEAGGQSIAIGDLLTVSGTVAGAGVEATSGQTAIAIAGQTQTATSGVVYIKALILPVPRVAP